MAGLFENITNSAQIGLGLSLAIWSCLNHNLVVNQHRALIFATCRQALMSNHFAVLPFCFSSILGSHLVSFVEISIRSKSVSASINKDQQLLFYE